MKAMSRAAIIAFACACVAGSVSAMNVSLGVKGGVNLANVRLEEDMEGKKMLPGVVAGLSLELKPVEMFSIQPEVLFAQKGFKFEIEEEIFGQMFSMSMATGFNYIEIPVLFKLNIPAGVVTPTVYAGPAVSFLMGVRGYAEASGEKEKYDDDTKDAIKEEMTAVDFGIAFGAGLGISAGPGSIIIDARYNLGLLNIGTDDNEEIYETAKNGAFSIMAGYAIDFGK